MNDNSLLLPSCSDRHRLSRRLTTDIKKIISVASAILFCQRQRCYHALTGVISLSLRGIHIIIICVVNNLVKSILLSLYK